MVRASRLLMACGRILARSLAGPNTQLAGGALIQASRTPAFVPDLLKPFTGRVHIRIPGTYAPRRSRLALRSHLVALGAMPPAAKRPRAADGGAQPPAPPPPPQQQQQQGRKKPRKPLTPEVEARLAIQMAAREGDVAKALKALDAAVAAGVKLTLDSYATVLYLCSGGDDWESALQQGAGPADPAEPAVEAAGAAPTAEAAAQSPAEVATAAASEQHIDGPADAAAAAAEDALAAAPPRRAIDVTPALMARGRQLLADIHKAGLKPNEICFTALARMAALSGHPDEALASALEVGARGLTTRLRCFTPALAGYAEGGQAAAAFGVAAAIAAAGLEAGEAEFARLLQAAAAGGADWGQVEGVLDRIGRELTVLQPGTLVRLRRYFASPAAAADGRRWRVEECTVSGEGECGARCGGTLAAIDLSDEEYGRFQEGVAALAARLERQPNDFVQFKAWVEAHGPFGAVVDAANVAFYGQNFEHGGFTFGQISTVVDRLRESHPELRPLVVLHVNRTKAAPAQRAEAAALLSRLEGEGCFYATPLGSNDDWYWMYAAVAAGPTGLLVSNDEMRDHLFQMLAPRYFAKWKQRHQVRYTFGVGGGLELQYPPPYTTCTQRLAGGAWMFPGAAGRWLCAAPEDESGAEAEASAA